MEIHCLTYLGFSTGLLPASSGTAQCHTKGVELRLSLHPDSSAEGPHNKIKSSVEPSPVGECLTVFKMAMRSCAKVMSPSRSLLNDPSKLDFTGRAPLVMLHPSSTFLAVLALVKHPVQHRPSENLYNREESKKKKSSSACVMV